VRAGNRFDELGPVERVGLGGTVGQPAPRGTALGVDLAQPDRRDSRRMAARNRKERRRSGGSMPAFAAFVELRRMPW
jgi:hypothetical protein